MKLSDLLTVVALVVTTGCARGTPATEPGTAPLPQLPQTSEPDTRSGPAVWTFTTDATSRSYTSTEAILIESQSPSGSVRDSLTTLTGFQLHPRYAATGTRISGTIDRIEIRGRQPDSTGTLPLSFTGIFQSGRLTLDSIGQQPVASFLNCNNVALARMTTVQRSMLIPARTLTRNQSWTDSSTTATCSGPIPVQLTAVRTYRVLGETNGTLVIERSDRTTASGEGAQGQHRITISSRGTGSVRLYLDRVTGQLVSATGDYQTEVIVGSSGRLQRFIQTVRESVVSG